ncbi:response regulator [Aridibaculum aurantiacum]|uniref:response regulator n=1 Tax=Aridibaculum aurantiacum TaxID=2810307 RepID=UPI001A959C83|nr:response regulator [Aridibaculum aurantiacum]
MLEGKTVLVAEDDKVSQFVLKLLLQQLQVEADIVNNGEQAVEQLKHKHYDLVLMDLQMPGMDGKQTTQHIRAELKSAIPVIAMTAFLADEEKQNCIKAGMNDYLSKPYTIEVLKEKMERVIAANDHRLKADNVEVNLEMVYEVAGNDAAYIKLMLETFISTMPANLQKIKDAANAGNWDLMYKSAHYCKSSLSVIKVGEMLELAKKIEQAGKTLENLDTVHELIHQMENQYKIAESILQEKLNLSTSFTASAS